MFLPVYVCYYDNSKSCERILMKFFLGVRSVTGNSGLDFGGDRDRDTDKGVFTGILPLRSRGNGEMYKKWVHQSW